MNLSIVVLPDRYAVCRLDADATIPCGVFQGALSSVTLTDEELSIVLPEESVQAGWQTESGWRCLKVLGPLDFSLTGILASISAALAEAEISIFALSTFDTDYILVQQDQLTQAIQSLSKRGFTVL